MLSNLIASIVLLISSVLGMVNSDTGLTNAQEQFLGQQYYESNNRVSEKKQILDYNSGDMYKYYQKKDLEQYKKFQESLK